MSGESPDITSTSDRLVILFNNLPAKIRFSSLLKNVFLAFLDIDTLPCRLAVKTATVQVVPLVICLFCFIIERGATDTCLLHLHDVLK